MFRVLGLGLSVASPKRFMRIRLMGQVSPRSRKDDPLLLPKGVLGTWDTESSEVGSKYSRSRSADTRTWEKTDRQDLQSKRFPITNVYIHIYI